MRLILLFVAVIFSGLVQAQTEATLLGRWSDDSIVGSSLYDNAYNEIWGYAAAGKEYAIIGSTDGSHIIDVTDPTNPQELFLIEGADTGGNIIHRDYHDMGCYLYIVCDEGASTLQIVDLSGLPNSIDVVYDSNDLLRRSHNIFIDEANKRLYTLIAGGGPASYDAMRIYDISEPTNPILMKRVNSIGNAMFQQVHDGYIKDNIGYLNLGPGGFMIADFNDIDNPVVLGTLDDYPQSGYNHSGWLNNAGTHYYMADETWGTDIKTLNVQDPSDIQIESFFDAGNSASTSIAHNQVVACDMLYVSYYYDGLQVYDISDPSDPQRAFFYETSNEPDAQNYKGAWGVYPFLPSGNILVSDMQEGLFVIEAVDASCSDERVNMCETVSTSELQERNSITLSPNPAIDRLQVELKQTFSEDIQANILALNGKVILSRTINSDQKSFNIQLPQSMASGMYLLNINGQLNRKFIKH